MADRTNEELVQRLRDLCTSNAGLRNPDIVAEREAAAAVLARMCGPGEVVISRASLAILFASYCREKEPPENFNVVVMPQYGADLSWIVRAWGDVHDKLAARPNNGGNDDQAG